MQIIEVNVEVGFYLIRPRDIFLRRSSLKVLKDLIGGLLPLFPFLLPSSKAFLPRLLTFEVLNRLALA